MESRKRKVGATEASAGKVDEGNDAYTFQFSDKKHEVGKSVLKITGKVKHGGKAIGDMEAYLFLREYTKQQGWYSKCDAVGSETQECSVLFFEDNGTLEREFATMVSEQCSTGGYLHIVSVTLDTGHRGKDLGVRFVKNLLDHFTNRWTLAMIQPYPLSAGDAEGAFQTAILHLSRYFARLGFAQCGDNEHSSKCKFWFLDAAHYAGNILDRAATSELKVAVPAPVPHTSEIDKEVVQLIRDFPDSATSELQLILHALQNRTPFTVQEFKNRMQAVIARGGDLKRANALQTAVAMNKLSLVDAMIELGADVNAQDFEGNTALHVATLTTNAAAIEKLLRCGADKTIKDKTGATPLRSMQMVQKRLHQFSLSCK